MSSTITGKGSRDLRDCNDLLNMLPFILMEGAELAGMIYILTGNQGALESVRRLCSRSRRVNDYARTRSGG